eukprot:NODE_22755_length_696_cov_1.971880.p1 GENE.NODE_22755_length_696_cov_1.971880~~NODE_22755_length_696_cov_1.971880.p1  ORF type:complete len:165 (+),score=54.71 NODE_22755_length_696_cov_1.971880:86-580(+)
MRACRLRWNGTCNCGRTFCDGRAGACCYAGGEVAEWRGLALLAGEIRANVAHIMRDALWLNALVLRGDELSALHAAATAAGVARGSPAADAPSLAADAAASPAAVATASLLWTKLAATECRLNEQCFRTWSGEAPLDPPLQPLIHTALGGVPPGALSGAQHTAC